MPGVFELRSPADLLAKLGRELERLRTAPNDVDHAFNFFVTAEHMLDWLHPGNKGKARRAEIRKAEPLLQLVSHLASGAKHFDYLSSHHQSVARSGMVRRHPSFKMRRMMPDQLQVQAVGAAGLAVGGSGIPVIELAERVYAYWKAA